MLEAVFAGAVLAITLRWISRSMQAKDSFARHFSRGAYLRDLNKKMAAPKAHHKKEPFFGFNAGSGISGDPAGMGTFALSG